MKLWWLWWWAMKTQKEKKALAATLFKFFYYSNKLHSVRYLFIVPVNEMSKTWVNNWVQSSHNIDFYTHVIAINAHEESMNKSCEKINKFTLNCINRLFAWIIVIIMMLIQLITSSSIVQKIRNLFLLQNVFNNP